MKKYFLILAIFGLIRLNAQNACGDSSGHWNIERGNTYLALVFIDSTADSATLIAKVHDHCKTLQGVTDLKMVMGTITFQIYGYKTKKNNHFGATHASNPMDFTVSIDVKSGKYRVLISNIYTPAHDKVAEWFWSLTPYNKKGCIMAIYRGQTIKGFELLEADILDVFTLKASVKKTGW